MQFRMKLVSLLLTLSVLVAGTALAGGSSEKKPAAQTKALIKISDQVNEQNPHYKAHEFFAKTLAEKSGGSVEVKIFPNNAARERPGKASKGPWSAPSKQ